jgi:uncharacterized protein YrrD
MDLYFGVTVAQRDGDSLGHLQRVVCDSETHEVHSLVVQDGRWGEGGVLVPIGAVDGADDDAVTVALTDTQFDQLDSYSEMWNVAPPPVSDDSADFGDEVVDLPDMPPVGAATGVESIAFTPLIEEVPHIRSTDEVIDRTTMVYATDGELGHVRAVIVDDETRRVRALLGGRGVVFSHDFQAPMEWIRSIRPEMVALSVTRAQVEAGFDG